MTEGSVIPREELVVGAKALKEAADAVINGLATNIKEIIQLLEVEIEILQRFFTTFGNHVILLEFIHSRLEYFLLLFLHVIENYRYDQPSDHLLQKISALVEHCINCIFLCLEQFDRRTENGKAHESEIDDLQSLATHNAVISTIVESDNNAISHKQIWYHMLFTSLSCTIVKAFTKLPGILSQPNFGLQRAMVWSKSEYWQVQQIGIAAIRTLLMLDNNRIERLRKEAIVLAATLTAEFLQPSKGSLISSVTSSSTKRSVTAGNWVNQSVSGNNLKIPPSRQSSVKEVSTERRNSQQSSSRTSIAMSTSTSILRKAESSLNKKLPQQKPQSIDAGVTEEICRNGFIRSVIWMLFHREACIRYLAGNVLRYIVSVAQAVDDANDFQQKTSSSSKTNSGFDIKTQSTENCCSLWAAAFEQGIISLLECAATGFVIQHTSESEPDGNQRVFPEQFVRQSAQFALTAIQQHTERLGGVRQRILAALTHSGHQKLRLNILSGIFFICGRSSKLGQQLWEGTIASPSRSVVSVSFPLGGQHFAALCSSLLHDVHEFKQVSALLVHFLDATIELQQQQRQLSTSHEIATQTDGGPYHATDLDPFQALTAKMKEQTVPTILIGSLSGRGQQQMFGEGTKWIKMVCPPLHKIRRNSSVLAEEIERYHFLQIEESMQLFIQVNIDPTQSQREQFDLFGMLIIEKQVKALMQKLDESYFYRIDGSYESWQEIFSHLGDDSIRQTATNKLSIQQITECLVLASRVSAERLVDSYVSTMIRRISSSTIVPIFRAAVCESMSAGSYNGAADQQIVKKKLVHLVLARACIQFLRSEWDFCVRRKEEKDMHEIFQCICTFIKVSTD